MPMNPRMLVPRAKFDPRSIAGLEAWWDAADASTVTLDSGRVAALADKSGKGRNATNSTSGSTQPGYVTAARNGRNVARFDAASSQFLLAGSIGNWNFLHNGTKSFVACAIRCFDSANPNAAGSFISTGGGSSAQNGVDFLFDDRSSVPRNNAYAVLGGAATPGLRPFEDVTQDAIQPNTYITIETLLDVGNATAANRVLSRINGGVQFGANTQTNAPSTSVSTYTLAIGRIQTASPSSYFSGDICEIILYSQHPADAAQTAIRNYLATKWGVTLA